MKSPKKRATRLIHAGSDPAAFKGAVNAPVYRASTVIYPTVAAMEKASNNPLDGVFYGRYGTPTSFAFEEAVAELEGADSTISVCSGQAAITAALMAFLKTGDHLLMVDTVYGPTRKLCDRVLAGVGVETTYYDPLIGAGIADLIRPETKVVFTESPGSLTFEIQDIPAIAAAAHAAGAVVILDNTWSAGLYFQPFDHGVDVSVQAATKYIGGHADAMLGTISTTEEYQKHLRLSTVGMGYCAAPDSCFLGARGLRTINVRLARHQRNGLALAEWFKARPEVARVLHPALPDCPGHEIWKRDFTGASGLFGVILDDIPKQQVDAMLDGFEYFSMGYSWGGFESLMIPMTPASQRTATTWDAPEPALRIHAGQEDIADLIADLERGFVRLTGGN
ncbi:MAG: cystathionine beta-lyase [Proteobacteria bacterium]|nr:cystathionine beta-lyase [Pseudomonadota bacterium]